MFCSYCGNNLNQNVRFCSYCGKETSPLLEATTTIADTIPMSSVIPNATLIQSSEANPITGVMPVADPVKGDSNSAIAVSTKVAKQKKSSKKLLISILAVLVLIVLGVAVFFGAQALSGLFDGSSQNNRFMIIPSMDETLIYNGVSEPVKIKGESSGEIYSFDGKTVGFAMDVDFDSYGLFNLVVYNGKETMVIEDEVRSFKICDDGSRIIYLTDTDTDGRGTLNSYDVTSKKSEEIADGVSTMVSFVISPDGETIGYWGDVEIDDVGGVESFMGYIIKNGGVAEELGENMSLVAVSDNANYMYCVEIDPDDWAATLYVSKNGNEVLLDKLDEGSYLHFNKDYSEILFSNDGSTYSSIGGADKVKISSEKFNNTILQSYQKTRFDIYFYCNGQTEVASVRHDVASFNDHIVLLHNEGEYVVGFFNDSYEFTKIISTNSDYNPIYEIQVSKDDKSLCFRNEMGDLLIYSNYRDTKAEPVKITTDEDIVEVYTDSDFSTIFLVDAENTLYAVYNSGDPVEIAKDVESLKFSFDESRAYFIAGTDTKEDGNIVGTLKVIDNKSGAKPEEIEDDVYTVQTSAFGDVYYVFDKINKDPYGVICEAFYSRDGKSFESVTDEAIFRDTLLH